MENRKLIYGTENPAKIAAMQKRLAELKISVMGLKEAAERLHVEIPPVCEDGKTPLENARKKAKTYFSVLKRPVFSCDSGLYIDGVPPKEQPGVFVRRIGGKNLTDEEMVAYYTGLARKYHNPKARYKNAICLITESGKIYESMDTSLWSEPFILASKARPVRRKGFPLDSFSIDIKTGKYYYDLEDEELDRVAVEDGFLEFFQKEFSEGGFENLDPAKMSETENI